MGLLLVWGRCSQRSELEWIHSPWSQTVWMNKRNRQQQQQNTFLPKRHGRRGERDPCHIRMTTQLFFFCRATQMALGDGMRRENSVR